MGEKKELSEQEAELYDRQIRLWGIEFQQKLRAADVLLIGIRGLGSEIAKNVLLSGINSLTILDDGVVTEEDQLKNFLLHRDSIGKKIAEEVLIKAQALNPLVQITADTESAASKDLNYFNKFTLIVATGLKTDLLLKIDKQCRSNKIKLIAGDVFGTFGYLLADYQEHVFYEEQVVLENKKRKHDGAPAVSTQKKSVLNYPELNKVMILPNTKQSIDSIKVSKRRNVLFYLLLCLVEFRNRHNRNPSAATQEEDLKSLAEIKSEVLDLYKVDHAKLEDEYFQLVFGEVGPVCAILGGVISQEVVKAVTQQEPTVHNVFLFNPITYDGKEETVGA